MASMTISLRWILAAVATGLLLYFGLAARPTDNAVPDDHTHSISEPPAGLAPESRALTRNESDTTSVLAKTAESTKASDALLDAEQLRAESLDNLLARPTNAEAAWMRRHGYPTYDEWLHRNEIPLAELEHRAARGDVAAQIMLADRLGQTHPNRAERLLEQALSSGSAFAASVLADQLSARAQSDKDPRLASVYRNNIYRLGQIASVLGDWRASEQIPLRSGVAVTNVFNTSVAIRSAFQFLEETNAQRRQAGLPPLQPSIRPGFLEWQQLTRGSSTPPAETVVIDCGARPDLCVPTSRRH